jgi:hypothetical protein
LFWVALRGTVLLAERSRQAFTDQKFVNYDQDRSVKRLNGQAWMAKSGNSVTLPSSETDRWRRGSGGNDGRPAAASGAARTRLRIVGAGPDSSRSLTERAVDGEAGGSTKPAWLDAIWSRLRGVRMTNRPVIDLSAFDGSVEQSKVDDVECLYCYLIRMLEAFGCRDGALRFTKKWIESRHTKHGWVLGWVQRGGGFCDCEVVFNVFGDDRNSERHRKLRCEASYVAGAQCGSRPESAARRS